MASSEKVGEDERGSVLDTSMEVDTCEPDAAPSLKKVLDQRGPRVTTEPQKTDLSDSYSGGFSQVTGPDFNLLLSYDMFA